MSETVSRYAGALPEMERWPYSNEPPNKQWRVFVLATEHEAAITAAQREIADLRNRLNLSEKLQGRFPVDAGRPADTRRWNIDRDGDDLIICFDDHNKGEKCEYVRYVPAARLAELESLLATRNQQNAAAFADRDALLADQRRLLYLASTASMNWGHRDRAGYTLDPLQFESGRDVIHPDDFRRAIDAAMAGPCPTCHGSGLVTIRGMCGGVEMDCDDQPCPDCEDIRDAAMGAKEGE